MALIRNILLFQLAWWSCVLTARLDQPLIGVGVALGVYALHVATAPQPAREWWFVLVAAVSGYVVDSTLTAMNFLAFPDAAASFPAPLWIAGLWLAFATTLNVTFRFLAGRYVLATLIGAASGPAAYLAGQALGVLILPAVLPTCGALALAWGVLVAGQVWLADAVFGRRRSSTPEHAAPAEGPA